MEWRRLSYCIMISCIANLTEKQIEILRNDIPARMSVAQETLEADKEVDEITATLSGSIRF